jgi:hypothetical protein
MQNQQPFCLAMKSGRPELLLYPNLVTSNIRTTLRLSDTTVYMDNRLHTCRRCVDQVVLAGTLRVILQLSSAEINLTSILRFVKHFFDRS